MKRVKRILFLILLIFAIKGFFSIFKRGEIFEGIYVIDIKGAIFSSDWFVEELRKIEDDTNIKAVILRIDSPGGAVGASQEIFREIKDFRERTGKKFVASIVNIGASGAYYIALACDKIVISEGGLTGSIGVISTFLVFDELLKFLKLKTYIVKSGEFKDSGIPLRTPTQRDLEYIQDVVVKLFDQFKSDVLSSRPQIKEIDKIFSGRIFTGREALELGLVDELGGFSKAIDIAKSISGIKGKPKIIRKKSPYEFLERIISRAIENAIIHNIWIF